METDVERWWRNTHWKVVERQVDGSTMLLQLRRVALTHSIEQIADEGDGAISIDSARAAPSPAPLPVNPPVGPCLPGRPRTTLAG